MVDDCVSHKKLCRAKVCVRKNFQFFFCLYCAAVFAYISILILSSFILCHSVHSVCWSCVVKSESVKTFRQIFKKKRNTRREVNKKRPLYNLLIRCFILNSPQLKKWNNSLVVSRIWCNCFVRTELLKPYIRLPEGVKQ